jgi:hypothetical protein
VQQCHRVDAVILDHAMTETDSLALQHYCNIIEASWLVNGGHGASLRHHTDHPYVQVQRRLHGADQSQACSW